jgi:hypothetical protein
VAQGDNQAPLGSRVSPEVFTLLTGGRGWSVADAETWLVAMCSAAIDSCDELKNRPD